MLPYPKQIKQLLREYASEAYSEELHRELTRLDQHFTEWRDGAIDSHELSHRIHKFHDGPSRDLYKRYSYNNDDMSVACAIVTGILDKDEIPTELLEAIQNLLDSLQSVKAVR